MTLQDKKCYAGIDVSKAILDVYVLPCKKYMQFKNDTKGIEKFSLWFDRIVENNWNIKLNLGYYPYLDYEPMAFWGDRKKLDYCLGI